MLARGKPRKLYEPVTTLAAVIPAQWKLGLGLPKGLGGRDLVWCPCEAPALVDSLFYPEHARALTYIQDYGIVNPFAWFLWPGLIHVVWPGKKYFQVLEGSRPALPAARSWVC